MNKELLEEVPGGTELLLWFEGRVPSFHDAEVLTLQLDRDGATCRLKIHAFEIAVARDTGKIATTKHVVVSFECQGVTALNLTDFNHQNVIYGFTITRMPGGEFSLKLEPCWGISGEINARNLRIMLEPGVPPGSHHAAHLTLKGLAQRGASNESCGDSL